MCAALTNISEVLWLSTCVGESFLYVFKDQIVSFWPHTWVPCCSVTQSCLTLCNPMACSMPGFPVLHCLLNLLKLMPIESIMPFNHLILCHPLLLLSIFPSIRVFSSESALCIRWPKYWSFHFSISLSSEYSELISFRIDWFDLLALQGTLKSLLQHHSSKASILQHIANYNSRENKE